MIFADANLGNLAILETTAKAIQNNSDAQIAAIQANPNLTPEQKTSQINIINTITKGAVAGLSPQTAADKQAAIKAAIVPTDFFTEHRTAVLTVLGLGLAGGIGYSLYRQHKNKR